MKWSRRTCQHSLFSFNGDRVAGHGSDHCLNVMTWSATVALICINQPLSLSERVLISIILFSLIILLSISIIYYLLYYTYFIRYLPRTHIFIFSVLISILSIIYIIRSKFASIHAPLMNLFHLFTQLPPSLIWFMRLSLLLSCLCVFDATTDRKDDDEDDVPHSSDQKDEKDTWIWVRQIMPIWYYSW